MWTLPLLTTLAFTSMASAHFGGALSPKPHFYCGRELAGILSILCYDQDVTKRAEGNYHRENYNDLSPYFREQPQDLDWPWVLPKARALAVPNKNKRYVVNECCEKPCSMAELLSYC